MSLTRNELSGDAESQRELLAVKEREARIDLLRRQFARRLVQRELSLGWGAWLEMYHARIFALMTMKRVANNLRHPRLNSAFQVLVAYRTRVLMRMAGVARLQSPIKHPLEVLS